MQDKPKNNNKIYIFITAIMAIAIVVCAVFLLIPKGDKKDETQLAYTELIKLISEKKIEKIEMTVGSTSLKVKLKEEEKEKNSIVPSTQAFIELVQEEVKNGNEIELIQNKPNVFLTILEVFVSLLPTIMIVALFIVIIKMQGLGDKGKIYGGEEKNDT